MTINVHFEHPPIPVRSFDYSACVDGTEEDGPYGRGDTTTKALVSLGEQIAERMDADDLQAFIEVQRAILKEDIDAANRTGMDVSFVTGLKAALRSIGGIV